MFHSHPMSGSHFIVQTSKFLLIDATAVILGLGHGKVIQYILPDLYILCPKYLRCSSNGGVDGAVKFLVVGTIGKEERPPQGQLWMEQYLISLTI